MYFPMNTNYKQITAIRYPDVDLNLGQGFVPQ